MTAIHLASGTKSLFAASLLLVASQAPAFANSYLENLQGNWKGKGSIEGTHPSPAKNPLACKMKASYHPDTKSLKLKGRCGSVSATSSFETSLSLNTDGIISGKPILQRGEIAQIKLAGKADNKTLKLTGSDQDNSLKVLFFLLEKGTFQTQSSLTAAKGDITTTVIHWKRQ